MNRIKRMVDGSRKKGPMIRIRRTDGSIQDGVLLSLQGDTIRIAGKGCSDLLEYRLIHNVWVSEDCEVVTFEFPLAIPQATPVNAALSEPAPGSSRPGASRRHSARTPDTVPRP